MASNTIKGLTVEIGGDTTKLGKALEDVNKKSSNLSKELGEINKLLKFDPGNADLLAQKQKVLAEAIQNTAAKLDTLKAAEAQVQEQFERGEVSEEQLRALQREIIATEKKLGSYAQAALETAEAVEQLGQAGEDQTLSKMVEEQRKELQKLKTEYVDVATSQGKNSQAAKDLASQIEALSGELSDNEKDLKDAESQADKYDKTLDDVSNSSKKAGDASDSLGSKLSGAVKTGFTAAIAAATAAVTALIGCAESTREYREAMGKLDTAFTTNGFSTEAATSAYKELQGVLGDSDQAVEAANHLAKLTDNEEDLATWTGDILPGVFATFGDSLPIEGLTEAANETAKVGQVTGPLADALNWAGVSEDDFNTSLAACSDEQERQALITETLAGLYGDAAAAYKETNAEVIRANQANEEWTASMADVGAAVEPILTDIKMMGASLLSDLVPGVQQLAQGFRDLLNGDTGAAASIGEALSAILTQILDLAVNLAPTLVEVALSLITTLITTLVGMLPQLLDTVLQIVVDVIDALSTALPDIITAIVEIVPKLITTLVSYVPQLLEGAITLLMAIVDALPTIIVALVEALPGLVNTIITVLIDSIPLLIDGAVALLNGIVQAIPIIIPAIVEALPQIITSVVSGLINAIPELLAGAIQLFMAIVQAIPTIVVELAAAVPDIITGIVNGLLDGLGSIGDAALQIGSTILDSIKSFFGIASPSTVMEEQGGYIVDGMVNGLADMPAQMLETISSAVDNVTQWGADLASSVSTAASNMLTNITTGLSSLPSQLSSTISSAITNVTTWGSQLASSAKTAASNMLSNVTSGLSSLPAKVSSTISGAITNVANWGSQLVSKAREGMSNVVSAVTSGLSSLPSQMLSVGRNLVTGLWNGISNMVTWMRNKVTGFANSVLGGIKRAFGIASPSKEMAWVGEMLDEGLAKGVEDAAGEPLKAMEGLTDGMLGTAGDMNGLSLDRQLQSSFGGSSGTAAGDTSLLSKLDRILAAIEAGQVIALDGDTLVGATAGRYDNALGQRRLLAARGAI